MRLVDGQNTHKRNICSWFSLKDVFQKDKSKVQIKAYQYFNEYLCMFIIKCIIIKQKQCSL